MESRSCCWIAGQQLAEKGCFFADTGTVVLVRGARAIHGAEVEPRSVHEQHGARVVGQDLGRRRAGRFRLPQASGRPQAARPIWSKDPDLRGSDSSSRLNQILT